MAFIELLELLIRLKQDIDFTIDLIKTMRKFEQRAQEEFGDHLAERGDAPFERMLVELPQEEDRFVQVMDQYLELYQQANMVISKLESPVEQAVINYRYLQGCSWEFIAAQLNCSKKEAQLMCAKAIKKAEAFVQHDDAL